MSLHVHVSVARKLSVCLRGKLLFAAALRDKTIAASTTTRSRNLQDQLYSLVTVTAFSKLSLHFRLQRLVNYL